MKITIQPYQPEWKDLFEAIRNELRAILHDLHPVVEHVGSTSVESLPAKPIIDINVGVKKENDLERVVERMAQTEDYIYYEVFNQSLPQRRLFVKLNGPVAEMGFKKVFSTLEEIPHESLNEKRVAHVHVWVYGTDDWIRHIAFRDYLRAHADLRSAYGQLKRRLARKDWSDGMAYNQAKNSFIKKAEAEAVRWYRQQKT